MELNRTQEEGLRIAVDRYRKKEPYTVISGYAGTGKSTLVSFIVAALNLDPIKDVVYAAYSGKAAEVLRRKGCPTAVTAHKLLYKHYIRSDGTFAKFPREYLENNPKLIILDEISMLSEEMWELLLSHHIHVIACGDPFQLPAITKATNVLDHPHVFLSEIMRQAKDSDIIRLSMDIREGKIIRPQKTEYINVVRKNNLCTGMMTWADQIICAKNDTRRQLNNVYRRLKWGENVDLTRPIVGDKLICLKNNWQEFNDAGDALVNGCTGELISLSTIPNKFIGMEAIVNFSPDYEDSGLFNKLKIDWKLITTGEPTVNEKNYRKMPKKYRNLDQFDYGYVISCHKSQGSQWPKVLVVEENFPWDKVEHARWLYTACTRSEDKLTMVLRR